MTSAAGEIYPRGIRTRTHATAPTLDVPREGRIARVVVVIGYLAMNRGGALMSDAIPSLSVAGSVGRRRHFSGIGAALPATNGEWVILGSRAGERVGLCDRVQLADVPSSPWLLDLAAAGVGCIEAGRSVRRFLRVVELGSPAILRDRCWSALGRERSPVLPLRTWLAANQSKAALGDAGPLSAGACSWEHPSVRAIRIRGKPVPR